MATTIRDLGFVEVAGTLEPSAIAAEIARDAHNRVAEAVTLTLDWLAEEGNSLNQTQKVQFVECVLRCMDGFERTTLAELMDAITRAKERIGEDAHSDEGDSAPGTRLTRLLLPGGGSILAGEDESDAS